MQLQIRFSTIAAGASVCLIAVSGCGSSSSSGLLNRSQSNSINGALDQVDSAVAAGDCNETANASNHLRALVSSLAGGSVNSALRSSLVDGADTVSKREQQTTALLQPRVAQPPTSTTTSTNHPRRAIELHNHIDHNVQLSQQPTLPQHLGEQQLTVAAELRPGAQQLKPVGTPSGGGN